MAKKKQNINKHGNNRHGNNTDCSSFIISPCGVRYDIVRANNGYGVRYVLPIDLDINKKQL